MPDLDAYATESDRGRHIVVCTRCGGSMISFEEAAVLHKLLGQGLERFLDPSPIIPEPEPPHNLKPETETLESLA